MSCSLLGFFFSSLWSWISLANFSVSSGDSLALASSICSLMWVLWDELIWPLPPYFSWWCNISLIDLAASSELTFSSMSHLALLASFFCWFSAAFWSSFSFCCSALALNVSNLPCCLPKYSFIFSGVLYLAFIAFTVSSLVWKGLSLPCPSICSCIWFINPESSACLSTESMSNSGVSSPTGAKGCAVLSLLLSLSSLIFCFSSAVFPASHLFFLTFFTTSSAFSGSLAASTISATLSVSSKSGNSWFSLKFTWILFISSSFAFNVSSNSILWSLVNLLLFLKVWYKSHNESPPATRAAPVAAISTPVAFSKGMSAFSMP